VSHRNARLTLHGRRLLVQRVRVEGAPVAHVAKAMGISRQCAHRWVARFDAEGDAGLVDRSSRPHHMPNRTSAEVEAQVLAARAEHRRGQDWIGPELGVPARTVSRILRRHQVPRLV
jgi:transposase